MATSEKKTLGAMRVRREEEEQSQRAGYERPLERNVSAKRDAL